MNNIWEFVEYDEDAAQEISSKLGISIFMARLLVQRGILSPAEARIFLHGNLHNLSDPFTMSGMATAVERINQAIELQEKIFIYGDYDVDGICSIVLLRECLIYLGAEVDYYVPDRFSEGYGLNKEAVDTLAAMNCKLLITVDCGINSVEETEQAIGNGIDVIITDHHTPGEQRPPALAVINPKYDNKEEIMNLAGVGVAFKVVTALGRGRIDNEQLYKWLDLVAVATVADIVPLTGENRILVKYGLRVLENTSRPGFKALIKDSGLEGKELKSWHVGFVLGPRLNSAGRLDTARKSIELLICERQEQAMVMAKSLSNLNEERRAIEEEIFQQALTQVENNSDPVLIAAGDGWHQGVIGIVASRLTNMFNRPSIVISWDDELGKASARSCGEFNLYQALNHCSDFLQQFGGHKMAAGLSIKRDELAAFRERIMLYARENISEEDTFKKNLVDIEIREDEIKQQLLKEIQGLEPCGEGNPLPCFVIRGCEITDPLLVGKKQEHLKARTVQSNLDIIAFNWSSFTTYPLPGGRLDLLFALDENIFRGRRTLQLKVRDLKPAYLPDNPGKLKKNSEKIVNAIEKAILEVKAGRPVVFVYPGCRALNKHLGTMEYFLGSIIRVMHGQQGQQERLRVQEQFTAGNARAFLTTRSYLAYLAKNKVSIPDNLSYIVDLWPMNNSNITELDDMHYNIETIMQQNKLRMNSVSKEEEGRPACIYYANRSKTIKSLAFKNCRVHSEAGLGDMEERRKIRQNFLLNPSIPLLGDGTHTPHFTMPHIKEIVLLDSPFARYELEAFGDCVSEDGINLFVSFDGKSLDQNREYLNKIYPEEELIKQLYADLFHNFQDGFQDEMDKLLLQINDSTGINISRLELQAVLHILEDLGLCSFMKKGSIIGITDIYLKDKTINLYNSPYFMEGLVEKQHFAEWEKELNKYIQWG